MKMPSVNTVTGNVSNTNIGLISALTNPSTSAAINAVQNPDILMDVIKYGSASKATVLISQTTRIRMIFSVPAGNTGSLSSIHTQNPQNADNHPAVNMARAVPVPSSEMIQYR